MRTLFTCLIALSFLSLRAQNTLSFKVTGLKDTTILIGGYYGERLLAKDTVQSNANGEFKVTKPLEGGLYVAILPGKKYFEFVVNEENIEMHTEMDNLIQNMRVLQSDENKFFYEYINYIGDQRKLSTPFKEVLQDSTSSEKEKTKARAEIEKLDEEVQAYQRQVQTKHKEKLFAKILKMSIDIEVPDYPRDEEGNVLDSLFPRKYYVTHYFDNIDLKDDRLVRVPAFQKRLNRYLEKVLAPVPDSMIEAADRVIGKTEIGSETFKFLVNHITNFSNKSKIMGMDALFVHMINTYFKPGHVTWMEEKKLKEIIDKADELAPILIGKKAPFLSLVDTTETNWVRLWDVPAEYTLLVFWDPDCGHCKKELPKLLEVYHKYEKSFFEVYSVSTELENEKWRKYIRENNLDWINVSDSPEINKNAVNYLDKTTVKSLNFRLTYDIFSTPKVFLLDKDKIIRYKQIDAEQLDEILMMLQEP